ncbi:hypothetical protein POSPLADRAFT_1032532 [Postia placenta MAD-698-R-SB12]|uniref:Uncharacterized protein n=1 Tax=Postia placenta MAD-698-R-SB12 TaxID=670580 RepID=A0A1X6N620_9APHY|nr:hypothetical protein POSPLADRAFT_1032532 [Postia placenta MAD-698-R-SB12]OSX64058.1 hypothetical protein POSPLADRAFT_1032532 [Postia placenta MAD-698-R-SB12]
MLTMRTLSAIVAVSLPLLLQAEGLLIRRQEDTSEHGFISSPTAGTEIAPGASFAFDYATSDWCHQGYSIFTVWLTPGPDAPTFSDVTSTTGNTRGSVGELINGTYLYSWGEFTVPNFAWLIGKAGLPPLGTPPPPTLTMPNLLELNGTSYTNADFYLTVVDSFWDCPPDIPIELGLDYVEIIYNATSAA